jgi:hypothetical protein
VKNWLKKASAQVRGSQFDMGNQRRARSNKSAIGERGQRSDTPKLPSVRDESDLINFDQKDVDCQKLRPALRPGHCAHVIG